MIKILLLFFFVIFHFFIFSCAGTPDTVVQTADGTSALTDQTPPEQDSTAAETTVPPESRTEEGAEPAGHYPLDLQAPIPTIRMTTTPPPPTVQRGQDSRETRREETFPEPALAFAGQPETVLPPDQNQISPEQTPAEQDRMPLPSPQVLPPDLTETPSGIPGQTPPVQPPPPALVEPEREIPPLIPPVQASPPAAAEETPEASGRTDPPEPPSFVRPAEPDAPASGPESASVPETPPPEFPTPAVPESPGEEIVFSRIVRAVVGQTIEIPFRGTGWVYLGELGNRRGIVYNSRRLDIENGGTTEGQSFIFLAEEPGTFVLKFYKQDFIQDYIINDHVQVIVGEGSGDSPDARPALPSERARIIAEPRWPPLTGVDQSVPHVSGVVPEMSSPAPESPPVQSPRANDPSPAVTGTPDVPAASGTETNTPAAAGAIEGIADTAPLEVASLPEAVSLEPAPAPPQTAASSISFSPGAEPSEYVRAAREEFDAGRVESALAVMDMMKKLYPMGTDEAWWLYGQLLEANSPFRDIRLAIEYYRRLAAEYPQSPRAGDALNRIAYLERYYFNIR